MESTECAETSAHQIQMQGIHPKERIQYSQQGESLKSRLFFITVSNTNERAEGLDRTSSFVSLTKRICVFLFWL
jgi:hypothetical protein